MLHWRCKILPKLRLHLFWCKLLAVSLVGHFFLLFAFLFVYKGSFFSFAIIINRSAISNGAPVVFLPFKKTVAKASVSTKTVKKSKPKSKQTIKPKPAKKTTIAKSKPKLNKKTVKTAHKKKKSIKKEPEKIAHKKKSKPKKKKAEVAQKKKAEKETTQVAKNKKIKSEKRFIENPAQAESALNPIYVGQLEMAALQMQDEMQTQVSKLWQPPAGLPKELACTVKIIVDWGGKTKEVLVEESSGVLMYDISARTAIAQLSELPRWARGKEFTITFKQ